MPNTDDCSMDYVPGSCCSVHHCGSPKVAATQLNSWVVSFLGVGETCEAVGMVCCFPAVTHMGKGTPQLGGWSGPVWLSSRTAALEAAAADTPQSDPAAPLGCGSEVPLCSTWWQMEVPIAAATAPKSWPRTARGRWSCRKRPLVSF